MRHSPDEMRAEGASEDIIAGMLPNRKAVEAKYGKETSAPYDDCE